MSRVLESIREQVRARPEAPALVTPAGTTSRAELWSRAGRLAERLTARGLLPGEVVVVHTGRTEELLVAVVATLRAGGAFCVVDPAYPPARIRQIHRDSGARLVVTAGLELHGREPAPAREGLAYVVFTSGSTGRPKAVGMPHRAVDNLISWTLASTSALPLRTLQFAPLGFDVFVQEVFTALCSGGVLHLPSDEERRDLLRVAELLDEWRIERLFLPPVALARLADLAPHTGRCPRSLREVAVAGEALRITPQLRRFFEELPGCRLHNHYGPSETHVAVAHTLTGPPRSWPDLPPIGTPVTGFEARVVDGELWLTGTGVGYGYLNDPAGTARRFVPAQGPAGGPAVPAQGSAGNLAYRTGDLVERRPDGTLHYLGRGDEQVKIRGHLVDPAEVEAVLSALPGVRECAVVARRTAGELQLVAYVVGGAAGLRERLAAQLPGHLVPAHVLALDSLPLSPNGKSDRSGLPAPAGPEVRGDSPHGAVERDVASVWSGVLDRAEVGRDQDFRALGGTSLSAALVLARLRARYPARVDLTTFLSAPTVRGLARQLTQTHDPVRKT
nr:non-ribosomal peptide synthetase 5 [Streptomyces sp.]